MSNDQQRRRKHGDRPSADSLSWDGASQLQAAAPSDLQQLKALALAAVNAQTVSEQGTALAAFENSMVRTSPAVVLGLIDRVNNALVSSGLAALAQEQAAEHLAQADARIEELEAQLVRQQAAPALPANVKLAGVKMANTMFNLAQRAGEVIDSDLCSKMDAMRKEWDSALFVSYGAAAPAQPAPVAQALLDHAHAEPTSNPYTDYLAPYWQAGFDGGEICATTKGHALAAYAAGIKARAPADEVSQGAAPTAADVRDAALEEAALAAEAWGDAKVVKWQDDPEMHEDAKARAWDALQCAVAIRALRAAQPNIQEAGNA